MRLQHIVAAVLAAAPVVAMAQATPENRTQGALMEVMKTNVAAITAPAEKARWDANVELWQIKLGPAMTKDQADRMDYVIDRMFANVARITRPAEKGRWQANLDMWKIVSSSPKVSESDLASLNASFDRMKDNVEKIGEPKEKERWQANRDLWRAEIMKLTRAAQ